MTQKRSIPNALLYVPLDYKLIVDIRVVPQKSKLDYLYHLVLMETNIFTKLTRTGVGLETCGIWISDGMCPVLRRRPSLFIYWTWSSNQSFSAFRDLHRENRTWAGEEEQAWDVTCTPYRNNISMSTEVTSCRLDSAYSLLYYYVFQRWCPTEPDHCSALSPRSWGADASTERRTHPWTVSSCIHHTKFCLD